MLPKIPSSISATLMEEELYFTVVCCIERIKVIFKVYDMHLFIYHTGAGNEFVTPCLKVLSTLSHLYHTCLLFRDMGGYRGRIACTFIQGVTNTTTLYHIGSTSRLQQRCEKATTEIRLIGMYAFVTLTLLTKPYSYTLVECHF